MDFQSKIALGGEKEKALLKDSWRYCYHENDQLSLHLHLFAPSEHTPEKSQPIMLLLHGGLWDTSMPTQLASQALHFSRRGLVTCLVEYRVSKTHNTGVPEAVQDVQYALQYLRENYTSFGISPAHVILCGAAGGGLLALESVLSDPELSSACSALCLLAPVSDLSSPDMLKQSRLDKKSAKTLSPHKRIPKAQLPPAIILHGKEDRLVPCEQSRKLAKVYSKKKNTCEFTEFEGADHRFYNFNTNERLYEVSLHMMDDFLLAQGLLQPDPLREL